MKIEIKNLKQLAMGREGIPFSASIYIDGKKAGTVTDDASGGEYRYYFEDRELLKRFEEYGNSQFYEEPFRGKPMAKGPDGVIGELVDKQTEEKELRRWCKKGLLVKFKNRSYAPGEWSEFRMPKGRKVDLKWLRDAVTKKHPDNILEIANDRFEK